MMNSFLLSLFVVMALPVAGSISEEDIPQAHLLSLVRVDGEESFVLSTIPAADATDQSIKTRSIISEHGLSDYRVCGVYRGHIIVLKQSNELLAIDMSTKTKKLISAAACETALLASGHLHFVVAAEKPIMNSEKPTHALLMMDLETGAQRELCLLTSSGSGMLKGERDFTLAATADDSKVAVTEMIVDANMQPLCRIVVVDSRTGEVTRSQPNFAGRVVRTGGLDHWQLAPKLFWLNNQTLLIAAADGFETQTLFSYQPATQSSEVICKLPKYVGKVFDPTFSRGNDGQVMIHLGSLGAFEILLQDKMLREGSETIGGCVLKQAKGQVSLHDGDKVLASDTERSRVFLFPDAQQLAWLPVATRNGMVLLEPMDLKVHDRSRGTRTVLTQRFPYLFPTPHNPSSTMCLVLTDEDLNRTSVFDQLSEYLPPQPTPNVDTVPAINESVELSLRTDKANYLQHEPIHLTIFVKNLAETPIKFESRLLKQGTQPFNDLFLVTQNSKVEIQLFERQAVGAPVEFVTIAPGQSYEFNCTVESGEIGKHSFQMRFEHYSFWKGHLKAESQFQVVKGGNEAERIGKKFDRLVARSVAEYRSERIRGVRRDCFEQLGAAGLPLLVEYLKKCEDGPLRRFLGFGLPNIADSTTLPYLRQLLKSDLQFDGDMVVEALWGIYRRGDHLSRPIPESTLLLIEAGKHRNVEVRRKSVATLCHSVNEAVDAFMQLAAEDSDVDVALRAARYCAARQQVSLKSWLFGSSLKMTPVGLVAARSIVYELEQLSQEEHGKIPSGEFEEVVADPAKVSEYSSTLKAWTLYCVTHPRSVEAFFDKDREVKTVWQGFGISRYASGANEPIQLNPRITHTIQN